MTDTDRDVIVALDELRKVEKAKRKISYVRDASDASEFMSMRQVLNLIPISRSSMYLMISRGEFPAPKKLGLRAVAWSKREVNAWIEDKLS